MWRTRNKQKRRQEERTGMHKYSIFSCIMLWATLALCFVGDCIGFVFCGRLQWAGWLGIGPSWISIYICMCSVSVLLVCLFCNSVCVCVPYLSPTNNKSVLVGESSWAHHWSHRLWWQSTKFVLEPHWSEYSSLTSIYRLNEGACPTITIIIILILLSIIIIILVCNDWLPKVYIAMNN